MLRSNIISFLIKLEAEKLPPIASLSINFFKDKDYLNLRSEDYKKISFYIYWLFNCHFRYIYNKKTNAKFWLCYECDKPYLWSIVDDDFIKKLLYLILLPVTSTHMDDFLLYLYTDISQRLKLNMEFERISFNLVLNNSVYIDLITGNRYDCDEVPVVFELFKEKNYYDSFVVLDRNHSSLTVEAQISYILNKLRNLQ
jgi:hypothetical protein